MHERLKTPDVTSSIGLVASNSVAEGDREKRRCVYEWYLHAMGKRGRIPADETKFYERYFGEKSKDNFAFGDMDRGFIFGPLSRGVFMPRHFAPKTMRGAYSLLKELGESSVTPAVLLVTDDLEATISKMLCWKSSQVRILMPFKGSMIQKRVVFNSHKLSEQAVQNLSEETFGFL